MQQPTQTVNLDQAAMALLVRWTSIASLLSMDAVVPFYELIGIHVPDEIVFRDLFRRLILDSRKEFSETDPARIFLQPAHIFAKVKAAYDSDFSARLQAWGTHIFRSSMEEHLALWRWKQVLDYVARSPEAWAALQIPANLDHECLRRFLASANSDEYWKLEEQRVGQPLSDWDLHMYALNGYTDDDPYPNGPGSDLIHITLVYQGFQFWAWVFQNLPHEDLTRLQKNAVAFAQSTKNLAFIKELPLPDIKGFQV